jgi:hypothetical protein
VDGDTISGYVVYWNSGAASGSFSAGTVPGYNLEDCASQCFDDPGSIDGLALTYTPPSTPFNIIDGHLQPGTCIFYEWGTATLAAPGIALAVLENVFAA